MMDYKVASIISILGSIGFLFVVFETGKAIFLAMAVLMLFNGTNYWMTAEEKDAAARKVD